MRLEKLTHRFGSQTVFQGLDGEFSSGEITAVLGPSGCGKSTLLRILAGLTGPTEGQVHKDDPLTSSSRAMVFQNPELLPWRNALENITLPREISGHHRASLTELKNLLEQLGIADATGKFPHELSGGMKMRVSLARALSQTPKLLLMDEPFSALDEPTRESLQVLTRQLTLQNPQRVTVFVTHAISEALFLADQIFVMAPSSKSQNGWALQINNRTSQKRDFDFMNSQKYFEAKKHWTPLIREVMQ